MSDLKCPHCRHEFTEDEVWYGSRGCKFPIEYDGQSAEFACPKCGKGLYAQLELSPSWTFFDDDGLEIV